MRAGRSAALPADRPLWAAASGAAASGNAASGAAALVICGTLSHTSLKLSPTDEKRSAGPPAGEVPPGLLRAVRHLLRPLVRVLVANQVTFPVLGELLKQVYVESAQRDFAIEGGSETASRLSLLTGIHRKDIQRLRGDAAEDYSPPRSISLGARVVARWTAQPEYLDADGLPRALPLSGDEPSFQRLVASVSTDIRPRAVIDEWRRLGVIEEGADGLIRLVVSAFVPAHGLDEKLHYFGRNVHDHVAAAAHNLSGDGPPMMERSVYYDGLSDESVRELETLAERRGMAALSAVNARALELQERDSAAPSRRRMSFGLYFLRAHERDEQKGEDPDDA